LPYAGYWARIRAGERLSIPALPKVTGELKKYIRNYVIKYRTDIDQLSDDELTSGAELNLLRDETKVLIQDICTQIKVKDQLKNPHSIIAEHKKAIRNKGKKVNTPSQTTYNSSNYRIISNNSSDNNILPLYVSDLNVDRAYRIIDTIAKTVENLEGWTKVGIHSNQYFAYFVVMYTSFYFNIAEISKKGKISKSDIGAPPRIILSLSACNWIDEKFYCRQEYSDDKNSPLEQQIGKIIYDMFVVGNRVMASRELDKRQEKREEEERKRKRLLEDMRKDELEAIGILEQASKDWEKAQRIRKFAECMETKIKNVADDEKREKLYSWLKWARNKADWLDPLTAKEDELLGKNKHIFDQINEEFEFE
jgi:hypothetical protein